MTGVDPSLPAALKAAKSASKLLRLVKYLPPVRRALTARALRRLEVGNTLQTFAAELGQPRASRRTDDYWHHRWQTKDVVVAATTLGVDPTVVAYSVKRVNKRFRPEIDLAPGAYPGLRIRLGDTLFAAQSHPQAVVGYLGANHWAYAELYYLGRPGHYRHFELTAGDLTLTWELTEWLRTSNIFSAQNAPAEDAGWQHARRATAVDGYGVYDHVLDLRSWPDWTS